MKQILQNLKTGATEIVTLPCPELGPEQILIRTNRSLISAGTERTLVEFAKAGLINKVRQQPEKVKLVIDKIKTDGLLPTLSAVNNKLSQALPMGYCNVGTIIKIGSRVTEFAIGDRVVSNGPHAEIVRVSKNLCAKIPDQVSDDHAVFTVLGAIALQGIRLAQPTLGEIFVVIGLGLIGQITAQLLIANGCRVIALDFDAERLKLVQELGAETINLEQGIDPIAHVQSFTKNRGVDGVLITTATDSDQPIQQAAHMCRKRGRIVLIGVAGLNLQRADFYEKELSFQVSCSYGPGRYDPSYEQNGIDYPIGFVRWTAQRNFEAFLELIAQQKIYTDALITHRFNFDQAESAYEVLSNGSRSMAIILQYPETESSHQKLKYSIQLENEPVACGKIQVGFIGAGNYASRVLIPAFKNTSATLKAIACSGGISGVTTGKKFGISTVTTQANQVYEDEAINTIVIASRHNSHAKFVIQALQNKKNVFVEKPLCLTLNELEEIAQILQQNSQALMVGFNRRFSPHIQKMKALLNTVNTPKSFIISVNAGFIPPDHWTQNPEGGGRIIGEACHFIDLLRFLAGTPITSHQAILLQTGTTHDTVSISLTFADGSIGTIHYFANGHHSFPKERIEVFCGNRILSLNNFRKMEGYGWSNFKKMNLWRQDKGQQACVNAFIDSLVNHKAQPIPIDEIFEVSRTVIEINESIMQSK